MLSHKNPRDLHILLYLQFPRRQCSRTRHAGRKCGTYVSDDKGISIALSEFDELDGLSTLGGDKMLSAQEVAQHASANSCWVIIAGEVYDVTNFLNDHPGGAGVILRYGGKVRHGSTRHLIVRC